MSLLGIVQAVSKRVGLTAPTSAISNTNPTVVQMLALVEEVVNDIAQLHDWQKLVKEANFASVAAISQGALSTLAPGFKLILNDTIWDRTANLPILGPLSPSVWQFRKAMQGASSFHNYRIQGNELLIYPTMTAAHDMYFEFKTNYDWISAAGVEQNAALLDTDIPQVDNELVKLGLQWRWKGEKGLDNLEDRERFQIYLEKAVARDGGKAVLTMDDGNSRMASPGIFVPESNW